MLLLRILLLPRLIRANENSMIFVSSDQLLPIGGEEKGTFPFFLSLLLQEV
jgi:hypothetical protein